MRKDEAIGVREDLDPPTVGESLSLLLDQLARRVRVGSFDRRRPFHAVADVFDVLFIQCLHQPLPRLFARPCIHVPSFRSP